MWPNHEEIVIWSLLTKCSCEKNKQEGLGRTYRLPSLIRHGQHWKRRVQQFFYCCVCIRYRGNVSTEPLPSNDREIFIEPLPSNDKGIFTEPLLTNDRGIPRHTATRSHKPTLFLAYSPYFEKIKVGLWYTLLCVSVWPPYRCSATAPWRRYRGN
jgi:hypothetical protein